MLGEDKKMSVDGNRVRDLRKKRGLSQAELGKAIGYSSHVPINQVENGKRDLTYPRLRRCAEVLDTTVDYLVGKKNDPTRTIIDDTLDKSYFSSRNALFNFLDGGTEYQSLRDFYYESSPEERLILIEIFKAFVSMNLKKQEMLLDYIKLLSTEHNDQFFELEHEHVKMLLAYEEK